MQKSSSYYNIIILQSWVIKYAINYNTTILTRNFIVIKKRWVKWHHTVKYNISIANNYQLYRITLSFSLFIMTFNISQNWVSFQSLIIWKQIQESMPETDPAGKWNLSSKSVIQNSLSIKSSKLASIAKFKFPVLELSSTRMFI